MLPESTTDYTPAVPEKKGWRNAHGEYMLAIYPRKIPGAPVPDPGKVERLL